MNIYGVKEKQQADYLKRLRTATPEEKSRILYENSGFASAVNNNRDKIQITFGTGAKPSPD